MPLLLKWQRADCPRAGAAGAGRIRVRRHRLLQVNAILDVAFASQLGLPSIALPFVRHNFVPGLFNGAAQQGSLNHGLTIVRATACG